MPQRDWEKYAESSDKWEKYAEPAKSQTKQLTSLESKPKNFYEKHPLVSEGVLGAASGVGVPETKTPVRDIGRGLAKTFEIGPNELDQDPLSKVMSYVPVLGPVYRMGAGLGEQTAKFGKELMPLAAKVTNPQAPLSDDDKRQAVHGAAGLTTEILSLLWGAKKGDVASGEGKTNRLSAATGAYPEDINVAKADLESAAKTGKPKTAAELRDLTRTALDKNTSEFSQALQPVANKKVVPTAIADAIRKKVTPEMMMDPEGRRMAKELRSQAKTYDKPWTLRDLYQRKQRYDAEGTGYFKKSETGKTAVQKTNVDEMVENAVREGVKDLVYPELDKAANKPSGYFRDLQMRQSSLLKIKDAANTTVKELGKKEAMIKGAPLRQKIAQRVSGYVHPMSGRGGLSLHRLTEPVGLTELSAADSAARSAFKTHPIEDVSAYIRSFKPTTAGKGVPVVLPRNQKQLQPLE